MDKLVYNYVRYRLFKVTISIFFYSEFNFHLTQPNSNNITGLSILTNSKIMDNDDYIRALSPSRYIIYLLFIYTE